MRDPLSNYFFLFYMNKKKTSKSDSMVDWFACESCEDETSLETGLGKRGWEALRGALAHYQPLSTVDANRHTRPLHSPIRRTLHYYPSKKKKEFLLTQQQLQTKRRHHYSAKGKLPFLISSNGLLLKAIPFQPSPFALRKQAPLLCSLDLPMVCHSLHVSNCNSSAIPE